MKWFMKLNIWINDRLQREWNIFSIGFIVSMMCIIIPCYYNLVSDRNAIILFSSVMGFWVLFCIDRVVFLVLSYKIVIKNTPSHE